MLSTIVDSKRQTAIVSFLIAAPVRSFNIRELSGRLGFSPAVMSKEMRVLEREGAVKSFIKNKEKFYLLSLKHKLIQSLKNALGKTYKYDDELVTAIKKLGNIKAAFLSGFLTGHPELPVDMLIVGKISLTKLDNFLKSSRRLFGVDVNYSVMSEDEFIIRRDTFDRFIKDVFDYPHLVVLDKMVKKQPNKK